MVWSPPCAAVTVLFLRWLKNLPYAWFCLIEGLSSKSEDTVPFAITVRSWCANFYVDWARIHNVTSILNYFDWKKVKSQSAPYVPPRAVMDNEQVHLKNTMFIFELRIWEIQPKKPKSLWELINDLSKHLWLVLCHYI
jgi:hypothetical protein